MLYTILILISKKLNLSKVRVESAVGLLSEGATVPFISRYRKEATGSLNEEQIQDIKTALKFFTELEKRKETILKTIKEEDKLTTELKNKIIACYNTAELEDLYLPYKPKKQTRAEKARKKGLESLAKILMKQEEKDLISLASSYLNEEVEETQEALNGAKDIIAEWVNENKEARRRIREVFKKETILTVKIAKEKKDKTKKYEAYSSLNELLHKSPSYRILAVMRGEKEGILKISARPNSESTLPILEQLFVKKKTESAVQVSLAVKDAYKRLMAPSLEKEMLQIAKAAAEKEAIKIFGNNLSQLLLAPPLGHKSILALDPGFRTGCKVVCLDKQGNLLANDTIYPHLPQEKKEESEKKIMQLVKKHHIEAIAIGNGTAGRETEQFIKNINFPQAIEIFLVNEDGASIYSASVVAREEFPDYDVTVRGAISIGRRLMDPLAELIKIDPKSMGVGQYQHDVDKKQLKESLENVVESCVNSVGVNVNTASVQLLTSVSGIGKSVSQNIVNYRRKYGTFNNRTSLKKIKGFGDKVFEQSAGFLRIPNANNPLDNSAVHPESYTVIKQMAEDVGCSVKELIANATFRKKINLANYINNEVGIPTLNDILEELAKPGRDPRENIKKIEFSNNIKTINDIKTGIIIPGVVKNITQFGVFVDIGIKETGLIHISQLSDRYIRNPAEVVKLNQQLTVKILEVDTEEKKISLSLRQA